TPQRCLGWYLAKSVPQRLSWRRHVRLRSNSPRTANRWTAALFQATKNWWSGDSKLQGLYHLGYHSSELPGRWVCAALLRQESCNFLSTSKLFCTSIKGRKVCRLHAIQTAHFTLVLYSMHDTQPSISVPSSAIWRTRT